VGVDQPVVKARATGDPGLFTEELPIRMTLAEVGADQPLGRSVGRAMPWLAPRSARSHEFRPQEDRRGAGSVECGLKRWAVPVLHRASMAGARRQRETKPIFEAAVKDRTAGGESMRNERRNVMSAPILPLGLGLSAAIWSTDPILSPEWSEARNTGLLRIIERDLGDSARRVFGPIGPPEGLMMALERLRGRSYASPEFEVRRLPPPPTESLSIGRLRLHLDDMGLELARRRPHRDRRP
jgi:hypothetical protein